MGKATLARQKAIGAIGGGKVRQLEDAGLEVNERGTADRLACVERQNKLLRSLALGCVETRTVAEQILAAAMTGAV
jgi:hypothetical protein